MTRSPRFLTTIAMAFALGLGTVFALPSLTFATQTPECPTDTTFIAKYDLPNMETPSEGTDVITFSDLQVVGNELKRFDFTSTVPIAFVYVKAGSDPSDSGNYDYRVSPVTSGNDLLTPTGKGVSHISFCGPVPPTTGAIGVTKYSDLNGNGARDAGEPTLEGWSFSVQNAAGASAGSITTGTSGSGTLSGLAPGDYNVIETLKSGWQSTDPADGTLTKTATVVAGQTASLVFGNYFATPPPPPPPPPVLGRLTVVKYHDVDRDGARDQDEPLLSGWTFSVMSGNAIVHTFATGADGSASVTLNEGTYSVLETQQVLWTNTDPGGAAPSKVVQIGPGSAITVLFGNAHVLLPATSETVLTIVKYHDANADGARELTEPVLSGFSFLIRDASGAMVRTATTDDSGMAVVTNLPLGAYTIVEQARAGWYNTDPGGAATRPAMLSEDALGATVIFGNATVKLPSTARLPSTSTDNGTTGTLLAIILGLAILTGMGFGAYRYRMR